MNERPSPPSVLRLAAAVFLGIIVGFILFLVAAMVIGGFNSLMGMQIPVGLDFTENVISAVLLIVFVIISIVGFCWKVWTTPPSEEEESGSVNEDSS